MDSIKVLMVDDESRMRKLVKDFLTREGYMVLEAGDGEQALDIFMNDKNISLVILDVMMPKMDGWETLKEIRKFSQVPVIMLTAKADERDELQGFDLGVDEYITKPFSVNYLQAKVENILARRKMLQAYYCKVGYEEGNENKEKDRSVQLSARDAAFLNKLAKIMEEQLGNPELNVDQLVSYFSLSRTNFFHKLKSLTGMAPIMYIKEIRMRKAAELIKENQYTMAEIAYMVGFSDPHYFSKSFKSYWGMTSTEYAKNQIGR